LSLLHPVAKQPASGLANDAADCLEVENTVIVDLKGTPIEVDGEKIAAFDFLSSKGSCYSTNYQESAKVKVSFDTQPAAKSLHRVFHGDEVAHYINIQNEKSTVEDKTSGVFAFYRKVRLDTKRMMLDLSDTSFAVFADNAKPASNLGGATDTLVKLNLEGTLFKFKSGQKTMSITLTEETLIPVEVDRAQLLTKY